MTDVTDLETAIANLAKLEASHGELTKKQVALEEQLGVTKASRIAARSARHRARAAVALGEGSVGDQRAADQRVRALTAEINAVEAALETLKKRVVDASPALIIARQTANDIARLHAARLAAEQLDVVHVHAVALAVTLQHWHDLHATAQGSFTTGVNQQRAHGVAAILARYGVRLHDSVIAIGHPDGRGALLTPEQVLRILRPDDARKTEAA